MAVLNKDDLKAQVDLVIKDNRATDPKRTKGAEHRVLEKNLIDSFLNWLTDKATQAEMENNITPTDSKFASVLGVWQAINKALENIAGGLSYQGTWNAATNTPAIPAASPSNNGWYYKVAVAGSTNISGISDWGVGDWLISAGTEWQKIDNSELPNPTASNGLTKTGNDIKFGGEITDEITKIFKILGVDKEVSYTIYDDTGAAAIGHSFLITRGDAISQILISQEYSGANTFPYIQIKTVKGTTEVGMSIGSEGVFNITCVTSGGSANFTFSKDGLTVNKDFTTPNARDYVQRQYVDAISATVAALEILVTDLGTQYTSLAGYVDDIVNNSLNPLIDAVNNLAIVNILGLNDALDLKADLVGGVVPSSQLPPTVDEILEYANLAAFPATGETNKYYLTLDTNKTYRWSGSVYTPINEGIALGETSSTAYRGDRGKTAYDHSLLTNNPHNVTKAQVGLGNVDNTSDNNKPVSTLQAAADSLRQLLSEKNAANGYVGLDANQQIRLGTSVIASATTLIMTGSGNVIQVSGTTEIVTIPAPTNATMLYLIGNPSANFLISNTGNVRSITGEKIRVTAGACVQLVWNPYDLYWEQVNILASQFVDTNVYRTGNAYSIVAKGKFTGGTVNLGTTMKAYPFILENDFQVSEMRINVTTAIAASLVRLGIYELDANFYPTVPLFLSGEISSATTGVKNIPTSSFSFQANKYYGLVIQASLTGVLLRSVDDSNLPFILGDDPAMGTAPNANWSVTRAYAALPNPFTSGGALNSTDMPNLLGIAV